MPRPRSARQPRQFAALLGGTLLAIALLSGCADPGPAAPPSPSATSAAPSSEPTPAAEPSSSPEPDRASGISTDDWLEYVTGDGHATFRYPSEWTLDATSEFVDPDAGRPEFAGRSGRQIDVARLTAPNGQQLLTMQDFADIGGMCAGPVPLEVLAVEPSRSRALEGDAVVATVAVDFGGTWVMGIGITSADWVDEDTTCLFYFVGDSSDGPVAFGTHFQLGTTDPLWVIDSLDDARAYMETDEYATVIEILRSFETS